MIDTAGIKPMAAVEKWSRKKSRTSGVATLSFMGVRPVGPALLQSGRINASRLPHFCVGRVSHSPLAVRARCVRVYLPGCGDGWHSTSQTRPKGFAWELRAQPAEPSDNAYFECFRKQQCNNGLHDVWRFLWIIKCFEIYFPGKF